MKIEIYFFRIVCFQILQEDINKFTYLKRYLTGPAVDVDSALALSTKNFDWQISQSTVIKFCTWRLILKIKKSWRGEWFIGPKKDCFISLKISSFNFVLWLPGYSNFKRNITRQFNFIDLQYICWEHLGYTYFLKIFTCGVIKDLHKK